jgi:hypothetical protein
MPRTAHDVMPGETLGRYARPEPRPVLYFDSGFPTRLPNATRLASLLREHGEPSAIQRVGGRLHLAWPIYPGAPCPEWQGAFPWPTDKRRVVRVALED